MILDPASLEGARRNSRIEEHPMANPRPTAQQIESASESKGAAAGRPLVSVLVVVRNGRRDVVGVLDSIRQQEYAPLEILLVDGMSDDGTLELVEDYARKHANFPLRLLPNPRRIQATGWNIGIRAAKGEYVLRIDAVHCRLGANYIRCCLEKLLELRAGDSAVVATGGRRLTVAAEESGWAEAIALAQGCRFGVGNAGYRVNTEAGFVDTVGMPIYDRQTLFQVGLFDESLGRSEDNDLHARLRWQGYKLYFLPEAIAIYHPRTTLAGLASQMFHNGWWISATVLRKRQFPFGVRHLIPFAFYLSLMALLLLSLRGWFAAQVMLWGLLGAYLVGSLVAAWQAAPWKKSWRIAAVFWVMHASYAVGTLSGLFAGRQGGAETGVFTAPGANLGS